MLYCLLISSGAVEIDVNSVTDGSVKAISTLLSVGVSLADASATTTTGSGVEIRAKGDVIPNPRLVPLYLIGY